MTISINAKLPRFLTVDERNERFRQRKLQMAEEEAHPPARPSRWHKLDDPMTLEQRDDIPDGQGPGDPRTRKLWLKFPHPRLHKMVVSPGYYDCECGEWVALLRPEDDGPGYWKSVIPWAWTEIVSDEDPPEWNGVVIRQRHSDR
jgi:hypothetical protein